MTQQTVGLFISAPFGSSLRGGEMEEATVSVKGPAVEPHSLETAARGALSAAKFASSILECAAVV